MPIIPPIDDAYINDIIKSSGPYNESLNKTQGVKLRELMKRFRDYYDQQIPTQISQLVNDVGYVTSESLEAVAYDDQVLHRTEDETKNGQLTVDLGSSDGKTIAKFYNNSEQGAEIWLGRYDAIHAVVGTEFFHRIFYFDAGSGNFSFRRDGKEHFSIREDGTYVLNGIGIRMNASDLEGGVFNDAWGLPGGIFSETYGKFSIINRDGTYGRRAGFVFNQGNIDFISGFNGNYQSSDVLGSWSAASGLTVTTNAVFNGEISMPNNSYTGKSNLFNIGETLQAGGGSWKWTRYGYYKQSTNVTYYAELSAPYITANRNIRLPDADGTLLTYQSLVGLDIIWKGTHNWTLGNMNTSINSHKLVQSDIINDHSLYSEYSAGGASFTEYQNGNGKIAALNCNGMGMSDDTTGNTLDASSNGIYATNLNGDLTSLTAGFVSVGTSDNMTNSILNRYGIKVMDGSSGSELGFLVEDPDNEIYEPSLYMHTTDNTQRLLMSNAGRGLNDKFYLPGTAYNGQRIATEGYVDSVIGTGAFELLTNKSTLSSLGNSDVLYPTQKAVKTYVDAKIQNDLTHSSTLAPTVNAVNAGLFTKQNWPVSFLTGSPNVGVAGNRIYTYDDLTTPIWTLTDPATQGGLVATIVNMGYDTIVLNSHDMMIPTIWSGGTSSTSISIPVNTVLRLISNGVNKWVVLN